MPGSLTLELDGPAGASSAGRSSRRSASASTSCSTSGLDYLSLDRLGAKRCPAARSQRIRLATQIGTQLTGVLYVLDEPSIGLHPRDNTKLIDSLSRRCATWATPSLVVEHDREMIEAADFVLDIGPGARASTAACCIAAGPPELIAGHAVGGDGATPQSGALARNGEIADGLNYDSLTTAYLSGARSRADAGTRSERRSRKRGVASSMTGARGHNLQGRRRLEVPLGTLDRRDRGLRFSGKSSLINQTLGADPGARVLGQRHDRARCPTPTIDRAGATSTR